MPGIETRKCNLCGRVLPITEFYRNGGKYTHHRCKECYKKRIAEQRRATRVGMKHCSRCGKLLPITEFYERKSGNSPSCKECCRAQSREAYHKMQSTKEGREKKLASRARYREARREQLAEAERLRRRKAGIPPKRRIDRKKVLDLYLAGLPVSDIAKQCNTTEHTVRKYASNAHIHRERADRTQVCRNCWLYPCFRGIDNMSSNLAETCRSWHLKGKNVK